MLPPAQVVGGQCRKDMKEELEVLQSMGEIVIQVEEESWICHGR